MLKREAQRPTTATSSTCSATRSERRSVRAKPSSRVATSGAHAGAAGGRSRGWPAARAVYGVPGGAGARRLAEPKTITRLRRVRARAARAAGTVGQDRAPGRRRRAPVGEPRAIQRRDGQRQHGERLPAAPAVLHFVPEAPAHSSARRRHAEEAATRPAAAGAARLHHSNADPPVPAFGVDQHLDRQPGARQAG